VDRCGYSADLKHCFVEWFFLGRDVGKRGSKEGQAGEMEEIVFLLMHCSVLGRHVGKEE
jgi:hypothetical protein